MNPTTEFVKIEADDASYFEHFGTFYAPEGLYRISNGHLYYANLDMTLLARDYCSITKQRFPIARQKGGLRLGPQLHDVVFGYLDLDLPFVAKRIANWGRYHDVPAEDIEYCTNALIHRVDDANDIFAIHFTAGSHHLLDALARAIDDGRPTEAHVLFHAAVNRGLWTEADREEAEKLVKGHHTYTCFNTPMPSYCKKPN